MITEDYCSEELTKLLLEKGCPLDKVIKQDGRPVYFTLSTDHPNWTDCDVYYLPTHAQIMKWLREVHKLHINIDPSKGGWSPCVILNFEEEDWSSLTGGEIAIQNTYEEAIEVAIKYSLENLI